MKIFGHASLPVIAAFGLFLMMPTAPANATDDTFYNRSRGFDRMYDRRSDPQYNVRTYDRFRNDGFSRRDGFYRKDDRGDRFVVRNRFGRPVEKVDQVGRNTFLRKDRDGNVLGSVRVRPNGELLLRDENGRINGRGETQGDGRIVFRDRFGEQSAIVEKVSPFGEFVIRNPDGRVVGSAERR